MKKVKRKQESSGSSRRRFLKECTLGILAFAISSPKSDESKEIRPPFRIRTKQLTEKALETDPNLAG